MMTMMATFLDVIDQKARSHYDEGKGLALRSLDPRRTQPSCSNGFHGLCPLLVHARL